MFLFKIMICVFEYSILFWFSIIVLKLLIFGKIIYYISNLVNFVLEIKYKIFEVKKLKLGLFLNIIIFISYKIIIFSFRIKYFRINLLR